MKWHRYHQSKDRVVAKENPKWSIPLVFNHIVGNIIMDSISFLHTTQSTCMTFIQVSFPWPRSFWYYTSTVFLATGCYVFTFRYRPTSTLIQSVNYTADGPCLDESNLFFNSFFLDRYWKKYWECIREDHVSIARCKNIV